MNARELMTPKPMFVTPNDPIGRAAEVMRDYDVGLVPVVDTAWGKHLVGVITDRDLATRCVAARHGPQCIVRQHMTAERLVTVTPESDVEEVVRRMEEARVRRVAVVDEDGKLAGIIAQADLARKLGPTQPLTVEEVLEAVSAPALVAG